MINHYQKWPRQSYKGSSNPKAKLTEKDVSDIRKYLWLSNKELAAHYGVTQATIRDVKARRTWKHIE